MTTLTEWLVAAAAMVMIAILGTPASAEGDNGRYTIAPLDGGIVKLDTRTGAVTECRRQGEVLNCVLTSDQRQALQDEIDRLSRENAELRSQLSPSAPSAPGNPAKTAPSLPSDADVDRALSLMERVLRRFKEIMRDQEDGTRLWHLGDKRTSGTGRGTGRDGSGNLTTDSGVLADTPYSFRTRFENEKGTNPEELIAAAHAGCFTMAVAFGLQGAGFAPTELSTEAAVTLEPEGQGFRISRSALTLRAKVPNLDEATFATLAGDAEKNCPVSKVLKAAITLDAKLVWRWPLRGECHHLTM
jgi:lipoyl-dependent peroxiredoxin